MSWLSNIFRPREQDNPAGSSGYTRLVVREEATRWASAHPGRSWSEVLPTGSMAPVLDSGSILLLEKVDSTYLRPGDIALFERPTVGVRGCHRVKEVSRSGAVLFSGDNNKGSDGWIDGKLVKWRVAGILYTFR